MIDKKLVWGIVVVVFCLFFLTNVIMLCSIFEDDLKGLYVSYKRHRITPFECDRPVYLPKEHLLDDFNRATHDMLCNDWIQYNRMFMRDGKLILSHYKTRYDKLQKHTGNMDNFDMNFTFQLRDQNVYLLLGFNEKKGYYRTGTNVLIAAPSRWANIEIFDKENPVYHYYDNVEAFEDYHFKIRYDNQILLMKYWKVGEQEPDWIVEQTIPHAEHDHISFTVMQPVDFIAGHIYLDDIYLQSR